MYEAKFFGETIKIPNKVFEELVKKLAPSKENIEKIRSAGKISFSNNTCLNDHNCEDGGCTFSPFDSSVDYGCYVFLQKTISHRFDSQIEIDMRSWSCRSITKKTLTRYLIKFQTMLAQFEKVSK